MSLDPPKSDAELLAMLAQKQGRAGYVRVEGTPPNPPATLTTTQPTTWSPATPLAYYRPAEWPIALRIPWSCLISDNAMYVVDKRTGKRHKTVEYKAAQKRIKALATDVMAGRPPAECPLSIVGRFWLPNNHRRDVINFGAALADSLKGTVFVDDTWLYRATWERIAVDVDAPRCELTISPLTPTE